MGHKLSVSQLHGRIAKQTNDVLGSVNNRTIHKPKKIIWGVCLALAFSFTGGIKSRLGHCVFKRMKN